MLSAPILISVERAPKVETAMTEEVNALYRVVGWKDLVDQLIDISDKHNTGPEERHSI